MRTEPHPLHPSNPGRRSIAPVPHRLAVWTSAMLLAGGLAACATVGPDYPGAPTVAGVDSGHAGFVRAGLDETASAPAAAPWWRSLQDRQLDTLIDQALAQSPSLQAAQARLRASRAAFQQQEAGRQPKGSASALGAGLWQAPGTDQSSALHLYSLGFDASWELDLFGGTRRAAESAQAQSQAVQADLADAQVSLAAEVASTYVGLRAQQRRQALLQETASGDARALALTQLRRTQGVATADEVEQRLQQTAATQAELAQLQGDIAVSLDRLALLTGQASGQLDGALSATGPLPTLPASVAVGNPAQLLQRRPDIRAAERRLASHNAQIGQQVANYFPKVSLLGNIGLAGTQASDLLHRDSLSLLAVPYLSWNVLDFGRTAAAVRQAEAGRDEALANYQTAVLTALQDANTALARFGQQRQSLLQLQSQQASSQRQLALTLQRRQAGIASDIDLLDAARASNQASIQALNGEASLLTDFVALEKALGLGWSQPG